MKNNINLAKLFSSLIIGIVIGYSIAYRQSRDFMSMQKIQAEQINEIIARYEKMLNKTQSTLSKVTEKHSDFLLRLNRLLKVKNMYTSTESITNNKGNEPEKPENNDKNQCDEVIKYIDIKDMNMLLADVESTDFNARRKSLIALSLLGSTDIKQQISQIIKNEKEDTNLRRDLINATDWQGLPSDLVQLIDSTDSSEIKTAVIQSAQTSQFSDSEKQMIDEKLIQNFVSDKDDSVRINTLDYFANTASDKLVEIVNSLPKQEITPELQKHIDLLSISFPIKSVSGADLK